ncbi:MAG: N-acetylmuramoyl-L-alanine amidase-like domain-containing protein [Cyanobacteria bacterium J06648_1]
MSKSTRHLVVKLVLGLNLAIAATVVSGITARHVNAAASETENSEDSRIYHRIVQQVAPYISQESMGKMIQQVSEQLLGAEYQAGLLDRSTQETLVISLQQFDCLLFIETVLAIAQNIAQPDSSYQAFTQKVENQRYWNGKMNGYCSRLHYFSDWLEDNQRRGNITNITSQLGGVDTVKKLNFMTTHRSSYPNLAKSDLNFECLARVEASLSPNFNYIPTKNISNIYSQLQPGDIVGVATNIPGLDFTHTGFVYQQPDGKMGLIHASPAGEVVIAQDLQNYIENVKNAIGIVVSRASEPKLR